MSAQLAVGDGLMVTTQGPWRRGGMALLRATDASQRWLLSTLFVLLGIVGTISVVVDGATNRKAAALALWAFAIAFPWVFWFSRLLLLQMTSRDARMPRLERDVLHALAIAALATIVVPAMLLAIFAGIPLMHSVSILSLEAAALLLAAMLPRGLFAFAGILPALFNHLRASLPPLGWAHVDDALGVLAIAATLLAAWRWHALLRRGGQDTPVSWMQPMVFGLQQQSGAFGAWSRLGDANFQRARAPAWLQQVADVRRLGPATPVRAMRVIMGSPFMPLSPRARLGQAALIMFGLAVMAWLSPEQAKGMLQPGASRHMAAGIVAWAGAFGFIMLGVVVAPRLDAMRRQQGREYAELALLPGWGTPVQARGLLLRAVSVPIGVMTTVIGAVVLVGCAFASISPVGTALLVLAGIGGIATAAMTCLRPLCGRTVTGLWLLGYMIVTTPIITATFVGIAVSSRHALPEWSVWAWLAIDAGLIAYVAWLARRFIARPHPFLQD